MNYGKEFRSFAKSEGINSLALDQFEASEGFDDYYKKEVLGVK
jgi:hypothetical protein